MGANSCGEVGLTGMVTGILALYSVSHLSQKSLSSEQGHTGVLQSAANILFWTITGDFFKQDLISQLRKSNPCEG